MTRSNLLVALLGQIVLFNLIRVLVEAGSFDEDEIFRRYRPLALDESWEVAKNPSGVNGKVVPGTSELDFIKSLPLAPDSTNTLDSRISDINERIPMPFKSYKGARSQPQQLSDIRDAALGRLNVSESLIRLSPSGKEPDVTLTKLITGKEQPTFVHDEVIRPIIEKNPKGKVLATYKILVPIYIPAVKKPQKVPSVAPLPVKYVKEVHTEMVPVKKMVSRVTNTIKAERVPVQIVTDYVKADGTSVPSSVDDRLKPNEKVLKSVVTNFE